MIPVNDFNLTNDDFKYLKQAFDSGWISSAGPFIDEFEGKWAEYCGMKYGACVANGTAALQIALEAIGISENDEVIMPSFTIISCAQAITNLNAIPVLVDSDVDTWCMDVDSIEQKITAATRAILAVHMYGHPVDMDKVLQLADKYNLIVVEDAAEVHGATYLSNRGTPSAKWQKCGGIGHISTFSFFANKLITTGEGGMVLTNNSTFHEKVLGLRNLCFNAERRFRHDKLGYNYRLTNLQAALGVSQINRISQIVKSKVDIGEYYQELLQKIPGISLQRQQTWSRGVYWVNGVLLDENLNWTAESFCRKLRVLGVETRPFFLGMHEQPALKRMNLFRDDKHPVSEKLSRQGFYLPSGLSLTKQDVDQIVAKFRSVLEHN